jgi:hypothetical protein
LAARILSPSHDPISPGRTAGSADFASDFWSRWVSESATDDSLRSDVILAASSDASVSHWIAVFHSSAIRALSSVVSDGDPCHWAFFDSIVAIVRAGSAIANPVGVEGAVGVVGAVVVVRAVGDADGTGAGLVTGSLLGSRCGDRIAGSVAM